MGEDLPVPSSRAGRFRAAICGFIAERRETKLKDNHASSEVAAKFEYGAWLADAARRVSQIQVVTHVLKATHPDARGSSLHAAPVRLPTHTEIGSHVLGEDFAEDVAGNAAALDVFKFLKIEVDGRRLLEWMQVGDSDLKAALHDDEAEAAAWMSAFASLVREETVLASHPMAKQVYWLVDEDPRDDSHYHLLQPMFSSALAHAVHADIQTARFGEANGKARKAYGEKKPSDATYREYRNLAVRTLGGSKPRNVSQLNHERRGLNYLLASLPPQEWKPGGTKLLGRDSALGGLRHFGAMSELVAKLGDFLAGQPGPTQPTRARRETLEQAIGQELALFGATVRGQYAAGWTRDSRCELPRHQQLWLDPGRTELPWRDDVEHPEWQADDEAFNREYDHGNWADQVACDFGLWLNAQLRRHDDRLLTLGEAEMSHFARQAVLDVAWPMPMTRRARTGAV